jgi:peroxiredoxin
MPDSRGVAIDHGFAERLTFIVQQDGKVAALIGEGRLPPDQNVQQALQAVKDLAAR